MNNRMSLITYEKSNKYQDLETIYSQCSGPGGLRLAEFLAEKMQIQPGKWLLDVGTNRGLQTCFLAREYGVTVVGIDPLDDRTDQRPHVEHLMDNARAWGVESSILALKFGVPETYFAANSFDYIYSATTLEMIRGFQGEAAYRDSLRELLRLLKPNGVLGLGEPMHFDVPIPADLISRVAKGDEAWTNFFVTIDKTVEAINSVGFEIVEADYIADSRMWWQEFATHDPFCKANPEGEPKTIAIDNGRWLSFGYAIARKKP
jgi:cyclopropane fatty-acyl-phospholipid synthase-like methyltransferase